MPKLGPQHVRVGLMASGVCHSDWRIVKGEWPHIPIPSILGHEGAGVVEAVGGAVRGIAEGDRVVLSWKRNCGPCDRPGDCSPLSLRLPFAAAGVTIRW